MQSARCWLLALVVALLPALAGATDSYQYDEVGNLQTLTNDTGTRTYTYDEVNRLDQEAGPAGARNHAYDLNGNRTTDGAGTTATFTASTDQLATINGTAVTLDAAGNLLSDGTLNYTWDAAGRLKTVSKGNKLWATYYYDYKSRRTRKETTSRAPQGAQVVVYHYDQDDNLLAETLATGAPLKTYIWDDGRLVGLLDHSTTPPTLLTLDLDQLGTPRAARNAQGTVVWRWDSDGYGTTLPNEDPDGNGTKTTIHLRFPGQYYDQESGLHYNWNRYYSPKLGRYISADPIGLTGGANMYTYVGGNPLALVDPTGLAQTGAAIGGAIGGAIGTALGGVIGGGGGSIGGTAVAPGVGTIGGAAIGAAEGAAIGGATGAGLGAAIGSAIEDFCKPKEDQCEELLRIDTDTCNAITRRRGKLAGRACHESASDRYAACLRGQPLPPLNTWNN